jgi:hypothetical protein
MSKISDKLARSANDYLTFDHDEQIKEFLFELGLSSRFKTNLHGKRVQFVSEPTGMKTHFILICLYSGCEDQSDNGYFIWAFPRSKTTMEMFTTVAGGLMGKSGAVLAGMESFLAGQSITNN